MLVSSKPANCNPLSDSPPLIASFQRPFLFQRLTLEGAYMGQSCTGLLGMLDFPKIIVMVTYMQVYHPCHAIPTLLNSNSII